MKLTQKAQPDAIYFHSNHKDVTYRIWQLLDTQKKVLLDLLLSESDAKASGNNSGPCPLPIHPDQKNLTRIDPEEPIHETGIYRDPWERKPLGDDDGDRRSGCCSYNSLDYTSQADYGRSRERAFARRVAIDERLYATSDEEEEQGEAEDELARTLKKD